MTVGGCPQPSEVLTVLGLSQRQTGCLVWFIKPSQEGALPAPSTQGAREGSLPPGTGPRNPAQAAPSGQGHTPRFLPPRPPAGTAQDKAKKPGSAAPLLLGSGHRGLQDGGTRSHTQPGPGRCPGPRCQRQPFPKRLSLAAEPLPEAAACTAAAFLAASHGTLPLAGPLASRRRLARSGHLSRVRPGGKGAAGGARQADTQHPRRPGVGAGEHQPHGGR